MKRMDYSLPHFPDSTTSALHYRLTMSLSSPSTSLPTGGPIGTPGTPWGQVEKAQWLAAQVTHRSYADLVVKRIDALRLREEFEVIHYGTLSYDKEYPLFVVRSREWDDDKPTALVTGGGA